MAEMQKSSGGKGKKLHRCGRDSAYYARYKERYSGKLLRNKLERQRRIKAAKDFPEIGSPSQLRLRRKKGLLVKKENGSNNTGLPISTG